MSHDLTLLNIETSFNGRNECELMRTETREHVINHKHVAFSSILEETSSGWFSIKINNITQYVIRKSEHLTNVLRVPMKLLGFAPRRRRQLLYSHSPFFPVWQDCHKFLTLKFIIFSWYPNKTLLIFSEFQYLKIFCIYVLIWKLLFCWENLTSQCKLLLMLLILFAFLIVKLVHWKKRLTTN